MNIYRQGKPMIDAKAFAEHVKMLLDSDRATIERIRSESKGKTLTEIADLLEAEFNSIVGQVYELPDCYYLTDILNRVYCNSEFYYELAKMIQEDIQPNS